LQNSGPPEFVTVLPTLNLVAGQKSSYTLPKIVDPDGDDFDVQVNTKESLMFTSYSNMQFTFNPKFTDAKTYTIRIKLTDKNPAPKFKQYNLNINVSPPDIPKLPEPTSKPPGDFINPPGTIDNFSGIKPTTTTKKVPKQAIIEVSPKLKLVSMSRDSLLKGRVISDSDAISVYIANWLIPNQTQFSVRGQPK
jgi:hypothetical protein